MNKLACAIALSMAGWGTAAARGGDWSFSYHQEYRPAPVYHYYPAPVYRPAPRVWYGPGYVEEVHHYPYPHYHYYHGHDYHHRHYYHGHDHGHHHHHGGHRGHGPSISIDF